MLLKLLQAWIEHEDEEAFFVYLDMEKAFDRCSWEYLTKALHRIGFDQNFIDYISLFYSHEYIHKPATYLDQKKGGARLMHLRSHMKRYLHPSEPPCGSR